jgi:replicative DNA helicase
VSKNQEAEKGILSLMLSGNKKLIAKVSTKLSPDDFYLHKHKQLFMILSKLDSVDILTVCSALERSGLSGDITSQYITELADSGASVQSMDFFTKTIIESSNIRRYSQLSNHIKNMITDKESSEAIKSYVEQEAVKIAKHGNHESVRTYKDVLNETMKEIQEKAESGVEFSGLRTGFTDIDRRLFGLHPGQMITIAGRTGMGKTALAFRLAKNIALQKKHTLVFSLEMTDRELAYRGLAGEGKLSLSSLKRASLSEKHNEWKALNDAYGRSIEATLYIDDTGANTIEKMKSTARFHMLNYGLDCVVIDHIQIAKSIHRFHGRTELVNYISNECKGMAKELNIPVIVLSQIGRPPKGTTKFRPFLEDLKQSGAIEEDSDVVMLLYRDDYYNREQPEYTNQIEVDIAKCRDGQPGQVRLYCNLENMEFGDLERGV